MLKYDVKNKISRMGYPKMELWSQNVSRAHRVFKVDAQGQHLAVFSDG